MVNKVPDSYLMSKPPQDIIEWGEANVVLPRELAGKGAGPWHPRFWQIEPLRAVANRETRRVSFAVYSRAGKSWLEMVIQGHNMDIVQQSCMFVLPSRDAFRNWNNQKLEPFLQSCTALNSRIERNRNGGIGDKGIGYSGGAGYLEYRSGRTALGLVSNNAELVMVDEVDKCDSAGADGSYADILLQRGEDCINPIFVEAGTPEATDSAIWSALRKSDWREWWVPCPHCNGETRFALEQAAQVDDVWLMHCEQCKQPFSESERDMNMPLGRWIPRHPERSHWHRGYHLSMFYSPDHTVADVMATYDPESIRGFYTQRLAMPPPELEIPPTEEEEFVE